MQVINPQIISGKKVILRYDIDVALKDGEVAEDFKLKAGIPTLNLCLQNASQVILIGHIGRPDGKLVPELSVDPIRGWFEAQVQSDKLKVMENLRFDPREEAEDSGYAQELANMGDVYVNEAFSSYRPAVSTTVLPSLLPHGAGLRFAEEVRVLTGVRENPNKPFVVIMGGAKVEDKLPVIQVLAKKADAVLVGGKLVAEIREQNIQLPSNVLVGKLNEDGFDIAPETVDAWKDLIFKAAMIIWNGPLGQSEDPKYNQTQKIVEMILESQAEVIIGGGDSIAFLNQYGLLEKAAGKCFISVGGGAMLKLLAEGTLPTVEALN